ncbi:MAG: type transporter [Chloroflexi bacterium]|nr:type transporter [Chloroflexota bacterium]
MTDVFRGIWVVSYRELLRFFTERTRFFSSLFMPLVFLVIFGAGFNNIIGDLMPGIDFLKFVYPGIIAQTVLQSSIFSGLSIVWDREFGFLKEILVAPLGRSGIVLGKVAGSAAIALMQGIIMLIVAPIIGVSLTPLIVAELIPVVILISISLSGLGVLIASRMRSQQGFQLIMQIIIFPLMFLSGVFFPVNTVPTWMAVIAKINPVTYGVDAIRQVILGKEMFPPGAAPGQLMVSNPIGVTVFGHTMTVGEDVLVVVGIGVILLVLAIWSFSRQE